MKRIFALFAALAALSTLCFGQAPDFGGKEQAEKMKGLSFLVGEWEGTAKFYRGEQAIDVKSSEKVEVKAGGTALFVTGVHWIERGANKVVVHDAAAILVYDKAKDVFKLTSQLANGLGGTFELKLDGKGYKWTTPGADGSTMRYTMRITEAGEWHEIGENSTDGKTWVKTMEMTLKKVK